MTLFLLLLFAFVLNNCVESVKYVKVTVQDGILRGYEDISSTVKTNFTRFHGIPFAKPPLRDLRFKAPQPAVPWKGVRDATRYGPMCIQKDPKTDMVVGSEDCLYLNVYTPDMKPRKPLAVIFFIPGYVFRTGSGDEDFYGPGFLMDYNVVLVTMNYRLGPFGFLCADTEDVPGNAALKDQVLALKWVQNNIRAFGGDPSKVTIYGHAGGAASASLHYVSPLASGLFSRLIIVSQTFYSDWSAPFQARRYAFGLARRLGLYTTDAHKMIDFLRRQPPQNLFVNPAIYLSDNVTTQIKKTIFTSVREKHFGPGQYMTDNPVDLLTKGKVNEADILIGDTSQDALLNTYQYWNLILDTFPYYYKLFVPTRIVNFRSAPEILEYSKAIQQYYFGNKTVSPDTTLQFVEMYSFGYIVHPLLEWILSFPKKSSRNLYAFNFRLHTYRNYFSRQAKSLGISESTMRDEAPYLFDGIKFYPKVKRDSNLWKYVDLMCSLWTDFAKYGNPTPTSKYGVKFPLFDSGRYIAIDNDGLSIDTVTRGTPESPTQAEFWRGIDKQANISFRDSWEYDNDGLSSASCSSCITCS